jgi:hypothetical protein
VCGHDLEAARARLASRRAALPRFSGGGSRWSGSVRWSGSGHGIDWAHLLVAVLLALAISPIGFLLAVYWTWQRYRADDTAMAFLLACVAGLAVAAMAAPVWFWSHLL